MSLNLLGRSFLTLLDYSSDEMQFLIDAAKFLKEKKKNGIKDYLLEGKNIVLLFEKTSTRTRCAFEVGAMDEGAGVTFLGMKDSQMGKKETFEDTAQVLGRMYDGIEFRGYEQETVETLAKYSGVPVFNGLTDAYHPTQILADFLTISEHIDKPFNDVNFVFVGDARNNMGNSLMIGCAKLGINFTSLAPKELFPEPVLVEKVQKIANETGSTLRFTEDITEAVKNSDVLYTDAWISMGEEHLVEKRVQLLSPYKVTMDMLNKTGNPNVIFMHCLPAFHNHETDFAKEMLKQYDLDICEVEDEVFKSKHSVVFDEAENRLHTIKAIMVTHLSEKFYTIDR